jgi:hypothetical protein
LKPLIPKCINKYFKDKKTQEITPCVSKGGAKISKLFDCQDCLIIALAILII